MSTVHPALPATEQLESRLEFETLVAELSSKFINLPPGEVDREIEDALRRVSEQLGIDFAVLWQWSASDRGSVTPTHSYPAMSSQQAPHPGTQDHYPWVVQQMALGRTVAVASLKELPAEAAIDRESARESGIKSNLTLPLLVGGEPPLGALAFNTLKAERDWPDTVVTRLHLVTQVFSNALVRRRHDVHLRELSRRLIRAHEEERALLARELHDDVTQRLAVLAIGVGRAEAAAPDRGQADAMRAVREDLVRLSEDIHTLAYQLHPAVLEELGLAEALRTECERQARRGRLDVSANLDPSSPGIAKDAALCLFRVTQEALNNVVRHASAHAASVTLRPMDGGLLLAVRDDGVGFDPGTPAVGMHLGLASMRERVRLVNGTLDIESASGEGTTVVAWVPAEGCAS